MKNLHIVEVTANDWQTYKKLRLQSLKDSPDAFGSVYKREAEFSDKEWRSRLVFNQNEKLAVIAMVNEEPVGLAFGVLHKPSDDTAFIYQMWVSPLARGLGVGRLMINRIMCWAKDLNVNYLSLDVTTNNTAAINLYKTSGFEPYGVLQKLRESSHLETQSMRMPLKGKQ